MNYKMVFVNMPVKKAETKDYGKNTNKEILLKVEILEIARLLEQIAHEKETETTNKPMIGDIGGIVIVFIGTVKYDTDNGKYEHYNYPMFLTIAYICYPMHQK